MLLNDFYQLKVISANSLDDQTEMEGEIALNSAHLIFKGHFPNLPIVPGVCMVQIIKEIVEWQLQQKLFLSSASNIKFLTVLNPEIHHQVSVKIQLKPSVEDVFETESKLYFGEIIFFKMKAEFLAQPKGAG